MISFPRFETKLRTLLLSIFITDEKYHINCLRLTDMIFDASIT